ncbi:MAG: YciI family protein [Verrucomicrobiota bacterium]
MSKTTEKSDYLLFFRGNTWERNLPPEELKQVVTDWYAWFQRLAAEGKCLGGLPLRDSGKLVSGKKGGNVADGPFAESKETIAGYFHLRVANEAEAIQIAQQCPGLEYEGCVVEVRPVGEQNVERVQGLEHLEGIAKSVTTKA